MESCKVSVIVPVYKVEQYINECIASIISQSYSNIEIILIDDGSPDNCPAICDKLALKDNRIKVIHKKNEGLSSARNAGLDIASGTYIMFTDSDDIIDRYMIEKMIYLYEEYNADLVCCESHTYNNGTEEIISHYHKKAPITIENNLAFLQGLLEMKNDSSSCNKLFLRDKIGKLRFEKGKYNEDILFLFSLASSLKKIVFTNEGLYKYRYNPRSITHSFNIRNLDVLYNALYINKIVNKKYPMIRKISKKYLLWISYGIASKIKKNNYTHKEPYATAYKTARYYVLSHCLLMLTSSKYIFPSNFGFFKFLFK